jgi:hypothetical protein
MATTRKSQGDDKPEATTSPPSSRTSGKRRFEPSATGATAAATVTMAAPVEPQNGTAPPTFIIGGPAVSSWREQALTRIAELRTLCHWVRAQTSDAGADDLVASIEAHLNAAEDAAAGNTKQGPWRGVRSWVTGSPIERTASNCEAAEADLLRLAPLWYLRGQMPSFLVAARRHLAADDPRRVRLEELARSARTQELQIQDRDAIVTAVRGATSAGRREVTRVRSFRNVLYVAAVMLAAVAAMMALIGRSDPNALPICFAPDNKIVCPTAENPVPSTPGASAASQGQPSAAAQRDIDDVTRETTSPWDMFIVELVGLIAASVAAAAALRNIRGTSTPYSLPVALALLKLPTGALTALLGLLLMRGNFVPGLSALDSSAQIIAWAIVFGYAQQLLTRLVDQQAHTVLEDVGGGQNRAPAGTA